MSAKSVTNAFTGGASEGAESGQINIRYHQAATDNKGAIAPCIWTPQGA
ncbi:MAG: hypothetical protein ACJA2E_000265 [Arenicella sp.]|jgi:hypothetical protein